jgi:hypothetical protein
MSRIGIGPPPKPNPDGTWFLMSLKKKEAA